MPGCSCTATWQEKMYIELDTLPKIGKETPRPYRYLRTLVCIVLRKLTMDAGQYENPQSTM